MEKATFAAGCFWGVEHAFQQIPGVQSTAVGYTAGDLENPTYEQVCTDRTGHAEAVQIEYDPGQVSYDQLLDAFWQCHDPTQKNRQGPDVGTQYRTAVYYHSPQQQTTALASKESCQERYDRPIATEVAPAVVFWMAEDYHQQYLEKRGQASCHVPGSSP
ncbi:MAG: peptide-methionine (S)-S-oxide reductase [Planctomycetaceae bacterium]|nr:peptide-methionine (S)-S-oxide reductase [Planctomycetaceae bacterium]